VIVVDRRDYEPLGRAGDLLGESARFNPHRRTTACTSQGDDENCRRPPNHGDPLGSLAGRVLSAKRTVACRRNSARDEPTGRSDVGASEYTPAGVGPEIIRSPDSSRMPCSSAKVIAGEKTARMTSSGARGVEVVTV
jgi:hypothetical protein